MYDEMVTVGEIRRRHLEVAAHVLERVAASGAEWADLDAVERAAVALRQVLDQERSEGDRFSVDVIPGLEITDEMIDIYEDTTTGARVAGARDGLRGWPLIQHQVRAGLLTVAPLLCGHAYRAGREDAARDIEDHPYPNPSPAIPAWHAGYCEAQHAAVVIARGKGQGE